jgi:hypothetical protein
MIDRKPSWKHASASRSDFAAFWTVDLSFEGSLVHQTSWLLWPLSNRATGSSVRLPCRWEVNHQEIEAGVNDASLK